MVTLAELQRSCVEIGESSITAKLPSHGFMAEWPDESLSCDRHRKACLDFAKKKYLKDSDCE